MSRKEQRRIVREHVSNIQRWVLSGLESKKIGLPAEWDSHELRCFIADQFNQAASVSIIRREPRSKRAREYKNKCLEIF